MGMYDSLQCAYPLPTHPEMQQRTFQTKSLDCYLDMWTITAGGRLMLDESKCHWALNYDRPDGEDFSGEVWFYDWEGEHKEDGSATMAELGELITFCALFAEGRLLRLEERPYDEMPEV